MNRAPRWHKVKKNKTTQVESILRSRERWCMNACNKYINRDTSKDAVWALYDNAGNISSLVVHVSQSLLPVLCGAEQIPPPRFLWGLFGTAPIHSLQGAKEDVLLMETELEKTGYRAAEKTDYDLMCINNPPANTYASSGPANLIIRAPGSADMDALAVLHAAYEQEEVLPSAAEFNAAVSRLNTERLFRKEQMLVAEINGRLVGKINTNAVTFARFQVGGVYVHPDYRGLGIARRMAGEFIANLVAQGRGISLFVKKSNPCARRVYQRIGFSTLGDYRINYY